MLTYYNYCSTIIIHRQRGWHIENTGGEREHADKPPGDCINFY